MRFLRGEKTGTDKGKNSLFLMGASQGFGTERGKIFWHVAISYLPITAI